MRKKILFYVLGILWIGIMLAVGMCLGELGDYQLQGEVTLREQKFILNLIYYLLIGAFALSCSMYVAINHVFKQMHTLLTKLTHEAKGLEIHGDAHVIREHRIPEFETLISAFDGMKEHYYRTTRRLNYQKSKAESIVNNLHEGIIMIDEEGFVTEKNAHAIRYLEGLEMLQDNTSIKYVLREMQAIKMIENALENHLYSSCEVVRHHAIYHLKIHPIARTQKNYGFMITITDITRTRQLEEIRYQFVTNVTHELKTPLTSIQGFVETLQEGAIENPAIAKRFLGIIEVETKRLHRLIQDILMLSEIESVNQVNQESVNMRQVVTEVVQMVEKEAEAKSIELAVSLEEVVIKKVSADHMKQVVMNLVSNALRYTDEGAIEIRLTSQSQQMLLEVKDTGIGIPKENLEHIFERFYRVDKSRSRKSGGTGLGLSITKHIIQLYKGEITVESEVEKGSCFKVSLNQE